MSTARAQTFDGPATAIDGDDLVIGGTDIRMFGIDAFETKQKCEAEVSSTRVGNWQSKV
jgi:endonuclease YncB( thermonuclease family)